MKYKPTIKNWPEDERPRERLIKHGPDKLSDTELLAIILISGEDINKFFDEDVPVKQFLEHMISLAIR